VAAFLEVVSKNNAQYNRKATKKVLLLYDYDFFYLGDTTRRFSLLKVLKTFFNDAELHINCVQYADYIRDILQNNPYVSSLSNMGWNDIYYEQYDVIICRTSREEELLEVLTRKLYKDGKQPFQVAVFALSDVPENPIQLVFPVYYELDTYLLNSFKNYTAYTELFISSHEQSWADQWLLDNGFTPHENLIILIDNSSKSIKHLRLDVYFDLVNYFLEVRDVKVLIFDEKLYGKKEIYIACIGEEKASRIIFAEGLTLRQTISIISSRFVRLILGPCTGTMHCAAGIYRNLLENGMSQQEIPVMLVYAGREGEVQNILDNKWRWWSNSLVQCIGVKLNDANEKEVSLINADNQMVDLFCVDFTADLILDYLRNTFWKKLNKIGIY